MAVEVTVRIRIEDSWQSDDLDADNIAFYVQQGLEDGSYEADVDVVDIQEV